MEIDRRLALILAGVGIAGVIIMLRKKIASAGGVLIDDAKKWAFQSVISNAAAQYGDAILQVAGEQGVDPFLVVALGERETGWGTGAGYTPYNDPGGTGDAGHGRGLLQIDDRTWADWINANNWTDPYTNITKGVQILKQDLAYFAGKGLSGDEQIRAALAAYNHGPGNVWNNIQAGRDIDYGTAGGNYSSWVSQEFASLSSAFQSTLGQATS